MSLTRKQHTSLISKIAHSRVTIGILLCLCLVLGYSTSSVVSKRRQARETVLQARKEKQQLIDREQALVKDIEKLSTEEGKEEIIRNKYRAHKEGEGLIVITSLKDTSVEYPEEPLKKKNFFDRLKKWFSNFF